MDFGIASVAGITVICYLVAQVVKATALDNKWLPILCGAAGAVLGVVGLYTMPGFPAEDVVTAVAVGIVSGLAATGANQVYKQLSAKEG
nr:MAG TPA: holin [Caudoviricetes sp.]